MNILDTFNQSQKKKNYPDIRPGQTVKVYQKVKEGDKERIQVFEGLVIAKKGGQGISATFTVRKISSGYGVERTFPLHSPKTEKVEIIKKGKVRRAKLYYLRERVGKKAKLAAAFEKKPEAEKIETSEVEKTKPEEVKEETKTKE